MHHCFLLALDTFILFHYCYFWHLPYSLVQIKLVWQPSCSQSSGYKPILGWTVWESHLPIPFSGLWNWTLSLVMFSCPLELNQLCGCLFFIGHVFNLRMLRHCPSGWDAFTLNSTGHSPDPRLSIWSWNYLMSSDHAQLWCCMPLTFQKHCPRTQICKLLETSHVLSRRDNSGLFSRVSSLSSQYGVI